MNKYFELQYWLTIVGLCLTGLFILIGLIRFLIYFINNIYRKRSKKWEYNYVLKRWEKVENVKNKR